MNVSGMVKEKFARLRAYNNKRSSEKLQALKKKRIMLEGEANIAKMKEKEKSAISQARKEKFANKTAGLRRVAVTIKKNIPKSSSKALYGDSTGAKNLYGGSNSSNALYGGVNTNQKLFGKTKDKDKEERLKRIYG